MSNSKKPDDCGSSRRGEPSESCSEDDQTNKALRDYNEGERPLLRSRAQRALRDVEKMLDEDSDDKKRRDIEEAIEHLERVVDCMADEPLPGITANALETEDWLDYDLFRFQYSVNGSMPMLLAAFVTLVENGVAPGRWVLDPLAESFARVLEDQDPELVASRLGLQAQGSGSASPLKSFDRQIERSDVYFDMRTLIEDFGLSCRKAAEAVIEKSQLDTSSKTLANSYESRAKYPDLVRQLLDKYSDGLGDPVVWLTENSRDEFLASFPDSAQRFLKEIRPAKT